MAAEDLECLAFEFFREFARYEYCLKMVGLREDSRAAKASWRKYAAEVAQVIDAPQASDLEKAIMYFTDNPPKKQIVRDEVLDWDDALPNHQSKAELILLLVCRVRNNLFHGGKFNNYWFEPQRSEDLMRHALVILKACADSHENVSNAYADRAH